MYRGVLFDLDGTLVDSLDDLADAMNRVLAGYGYPLQPREAYRYFIGKGIRNLVFQALPEEERQEKTLRRCYESMMADYNANCLNKTELYAGVRGLIQNLRNRNIRLAVFSNKADEPTHKIIDAFIGLHAFDAVVGAQPSIPKKPDPSGALLISQTLRLPPRDIVYLGDTGIDMKTATGAGMFAVGALWGFRTGAELLAAGAQILAEQPADLLRLFPLLQ